MFNTFDIKKCSDNKKHKILTIQLFVYDEKIFVCICNDAIQATYFEWAEY